MSGQPVADWTTGAEAIVYQACAACGRGNRPAAERQDGEGRDKSVEGNQLGLGRPDGLAEILR